MHDAAVAALSGPDYEEEAAHLLRARQDLHEALHMLGAAMGNVRAAKQSILNQCGEPPAAGSSEEAMLLVHVQR